MTPADYSYKILIADDDVMNLEVLKVIIGKKYQVKLVSSGSECLDVVKFGDYNPDLILLDVVMPSPDGFEVCRQLKIDSRYADIPVIFLSSKFQTEDKVKAFELGGADYITKPFEFEEVLARIKTHLDLKTALEKISRYNKDLENMLAVRTRELIQSEKASAFSLLIQGIIHNLKGPIAIMNGNSEIISMLIENLHKGKIQFGEKFINDITKMNTRIFNASHKMNNMVESMMAKSRADKSDQLEIADLNKILRQELDFMDVDLNYKHKIVKTINLHEQPLMINIVLSEINQIIENLLRNSLDAMWKQEKCEIIIESGYADGYAWFSLADNGPGIPKDMLNNIFDPFFTTKPRERKDGSKEPIGTGLGLYSCQEIIRSYNGTLQIDSNYTTGAKFVICLPLVEKEITQADETEQKVFTE